MSSDYDASQTPRNIYQRELLRLNRLGLREKRVWGTPAERFWSKVDKTGDCWLWTGGKSSDGYGSFYDKRVMGTHRWAYQAVRGPIPRGLTLDHLCRNRACVNPDHLEPVTQAENCLRGTSPIAANARKTHCKRGHEFTHENTIYRQKPSGRMGRTCRACVRDWEARNR